MAFQPGISGFVRIPTAIDPNKVYAIGPGGRPIANESDLMKATGATSVAHAWQLANVRLITPDDALKIGITAPEARAANPVSSTPDMLQATPMQKWVQRQSATSATSATSSPSPNVLPDPDVVGNQTLERYNQPTTKSPEEILVDVQRIIAANPATGSVGGRNNVPNGAQWDAAASAIDAKYGPGTATKYDAQLKTAYAQPAVTAKTFSKTDVLPDVAGNQTLERYNQPTANFTDTNKVYLYDAQEKTYRPIDSPTALLNLLGLSDTPENLKLAFEQVNVLTPPDLNDSAWKGKIISQSDSIKDNGKIPDTPPVFVSNAVIGDGTLDTYGRPKATSEATNKAIALIGQNLTSALLAGDINQATFDKYIKTAGDSNMVAEYANALLNGGYKFDDIYADLKAKELADGGNSAYANFKGIDLNLTADKFYLTESGKKSLQEQTTSLKPSEKYKNINPSVWGLPIFKLPGDAFKIKVAPIDITSPEFKAEADKIKASYYDIMTQYAEATTAQAKAVADSNWKTFKGNLDKAYNLKLSDNARTAWGQLQGLFSGAASKGLGDSGIYREAMDKYLKDVRRSDQLNRDAKLTDLEAKNKERLLANGTPEEIKAFADANPVKAKEWGLVPSDETKAWWDINNLKTLYPDKTDAELQAYKDMIIDADGNYRSNLYQTLYANKNKLGEEKKTYQQSQLEQQKLLAEQKAYSPYTDENPFSSYQPNPTDVATESDAAAKIAADKAAADKLITPKITPVQQAMKNYMETGNPTISSAQTTPEASPVTKDYLDTIKSVFGNSWTSSLPSDIQNNKGVLGAVSITDSAEPWKVYKLGKTSASWIETPKAYEDIFGDLSQKNRVGKITKLQAKALGIPGF